VEEARRNVDIDLATETIATLPVHQQLVLLSVCNLSIEGSRYQKLGGSGSSGGLSNSLHPHGTTGTGHEASGEHFLMSGEVYEEYSRVCRHYRKPKRSARWYREYLNDLEMLGLITTVESGRGMRGHTRLIKPGYVPEQMKKIIEGGTAIRGPDDSLTEGTQAVLGGPKVDDKESG
jgi:cell division control protein 6